MLARDAGADGGFHAGFEKIEHVEQHVIVNRVILHGARIALRMHENDRHAEIGRGFQR